MSAKTNSYFVFQLARQEDNSVDPAPEWPPVEPTPIPPVTDPFPTVPSVNGAHFQYFSFMLN